jgi:rhodanese-related sulfurtransferase
MNHFFAPETLLERQGRADAPLLIDVRSEDEYAAGHIPGAVNIPVDDLASRLDEFPDGQEIVTYCMLNHPGSSRGERASELLRQHGRQATTLGGGFKEWRERNRPVQTPS